MKRIHASRGPLRFRMLRRPVLVFAMLSTLAVIAVLTLVLVGACTSDDPNAALRAEAEKLCPNEYLDSCVDGYIKTANSLLPAALCVSEAGGTWFMETPGEGVEIGDACAGESTHTVVALLNYN